MFWFVMYVNESIESTHCEHVCFQGSNFVALFTFKKKKFSNCFGFGAHIVSTVILTNYERTHKATTRQSVSNGFYWQSKIRPPICAPFGTIHVVSVCVWMCIVHAPSVQMVQSFYCLLLLYREEWLFSPDNFCIDLRVLIVIKIFWRAQFPK